MAVDLAWLFTWQLDASSVLAREESAALSWDLQFDNDG